MAEYIQDILAVLGQSLNSISQGVMAMGLGFSMTASAWAFAIAAVLSVVFTNVVPLSFQAESLALIGTIGEDSRERRHILIWSSILLLLVGMTSFSNWLADFAGEQVLAGMMAGVGLMLSKIGWQNIQDERAVGYSSLAIALVVYLVTGNLAWTVVASVLGSSLVYYVMYRDDIKKSATETADQLEKPIKPVLSFKIARGVLSFVTLNIAGNLSYGLITGQMTGITPNPANINHMNIIEGISNFVSALFGGAPVGGVISATGAAPHPVFANVLMTALIAFVMFIKLLPKMSHYIPKESLAGFLFILGVFVVFPDNAVAALTAGSLVGGLTIILTAITDPFMGLMAGIILQYALLILQ